MLDARVKGIVARDRQKGILLDTSLFVLFVIGLFDRSRIATFKRTRAFGQEDFDYLIEILRGFDRIITTPNTLTEVSNLLGQFDEPEEVRAVLARELRRLAKERYVASLPICVDQEFGRLGLTDLAIGTLARKKYPVLTVDLDLYLYLSARRPNVINFNHIRPAATS
jgi:hypothetical protein